MALSAAEEALVRELIAQNPELLSLAGNEATIISKLGATKKNLSQLAAALSLNDTDLAFVRQGSSDKSVALSVLKAFARSGIDLSQYLPKSGGSMTGLLNFAAGANIASSATVNLSTATGNTVHITGTTGIRAWTMSSGQVMDVIFDGVLTLTHHATNNNLPGTANITTAAGDRARFFYDGTTVYCLSYALADGTALVGVTPSDLTAYSQRTLTAEIASTSGTSIAFTGIPDWAKKITINFSGVSTSGSSGWLVRVGTSSGVVSAGYASHGNTLGDNVVSGATSSTGLLQSAAVSASAAYSGISQLSKHSGNTWVNSASIGTGVSVGSGQLIGSGSISLGDVLYRVVVTTSNGADTFDAGSISLLIEG